MDWKAEYLTETTSTNDEARDDRYSHGCVVVAERQTAGRGQRGNRWSSREGCNLMFSVVLAPAFLPAAHQFLLSEAVSLAVADALGTYGIEASVKWPNDIYVGERKIAGILIENDIKGGVMSRSIAGIGLNVNQTEFDLSLPNPTSMRLVTGVEYDRLEVLRRVLEALGTGYEALAGGLTEGIERDYHRRLYRAGRRHEFALPGGERFGGIIQKVGPDGRIEILADGGDPMFFYFKEVEFL